MTYRIKEEVIEAAIETLAVLFIAENARQHDGRESIYGLSAIPADVLMYFNFPFVKYPRLCTGSELPRRKRRGINNKRVMAINPLHPGKRPLFFSGWMEG